MVPNMNNNDYLQAGRSTTPAALLQKLARSTCTRVRTRVAENQSTPRNLLDVLRKDVSTDVRIGLTHNPATPTAILWELANDEDLDVRYSLAENANTLPLILIWLSGDENPYIAQRAHKTIEALLGKENAPRKGDTHMATKTLERTLRRMLSRKERLSKADAIRLKELILNDGYLSRSEIKIVQRAMDNNLLDEAAFEIFLELLLYKYGDEIGDRAIA